MMRVDSIVQSIRQRLGSYRRDLRGNVAIIVAFSIIPLVGALGLATDTSRGFLLKARLSQALDAAALAGSKVFYSPTRDDDVRKFFEANFPPGFMNASPNPIVLTIEEDLTDENNPKLKVSADATIPTTFMRVLGFESMNVPALAQATRSIKALDVVISLDMSGSMQETAGGEVKIIAARDAAVTFLDTIFQDEDVSPTIDVDGTTYNLLNVGFVPWNSKVRVTLQNGTTGTSNSVDSTESPSGFDTNPVTGLAQTTVYYGRDRDGRPSPVPLLSSPAALPGGWSGCIYARYLGADNETAPGIDPDDNTNDADTQRGQITVGDSQWYGWEPMAVYEAEPRSGSWSSNSPDSEPDTRWRGASRSCYNAYINDSGGTSNRNYDNANGTIKDAGNEDSSRPVFRNPSGTADDFPNTIVAPATTTGFRSSPIAGVYSGSYRRWANAENDNSNGTTGGDLLASSSYAQPNIGTASGSGSITDCTACLTRGIIPLTPSRTEIRTLLTAITDTDPDGNTNGEQGLYWAWEVLWPGVPFTEALVSTPFPRDRAIILLTDGAQVGGNGDAYKGRFGSGENAGTNDLDIHGDISYTYWDNAAKTQTSTTGDNNLNNRMRQLADNIKEDGIEIFVIGLDLEDNPTALDMLEDVASWPKEDHFFNAPTSEDLEEIFAQIAASLSTVHLSM